MVMSTSDVTSIHHLTTRAELNQITHEDDKPSADLQSSAKSTQNIQSIIKSYNGFICINHLTTHAELNQMIHEWVSHWGSPKIIILRDT